MEDIRSKKKLKRDITKEIINMFHTALDYAQVACPTQDVFLALRSKILRSGNNCIRNSEHIIDNYEVKYISNSEEIIQFKN